MARACPWGPPTARFHPQNPLTAITVWPKGSQALPYRVKVQDQASKIPPIPGHSEKVQPQESLFKTCLSLFVPKQRQPPSYVSPNESLVWGLLCSVTLLFLGSQLPHLSPQSSNNYIWGWIPFPSELEHVSNKIVFLNLHLLKDSGINNTVVNRL